MGSQWEQTGNRPETHRVGWKLVPPILCLVLQVVIAQIRPVFAGAVKHFLPIADVFGQLLVVETVRVPAIYQTRLLNPVIRLISFAARLKRFD